MSVTVGDFAAKLGTGEMAETDPKTMQDLTSVVRKARTGPRRGGLATEVSWLRLWRRAWPRYVL